MASVGRFIGTMPLKITQQLQNSIPFSKPCNRRTTIITCSKPSRKDISKGPPGGQTNSIGPLREEIRDSFGSSKSRNNSNNIKGGVGGSPKKTSNSLS
ncbi:hypothetical protein FEM48_Zijuj12G0116700 [Ziziphus jujuba var. spinosa]|uniref:Uncharacterized protein n=1 Tax=Ziziphus jujuba var. spinosa TaxID=714518 RepID=A0A978UD39_ZIZJJ|nr:hypothetical protein FEM48_Zijuj12G0116700 [Ziziphus jujuba var. spinosa]